MASIGSQGLGVCVVFPALGDSWCPHRRTPPSLTAPLRGTQQIGWSDLPCRRQEEVVLLSLTMTLIQGDSKHRLLASPDVKNVMRRAQGPPVTE